MNFKNQNVPDKNGSPMIMSAILNFGITDAIAYTYSVNNPGAYI